VPTMRKALRSRRAKRFLAMCRPPLTPRVLTWRMAGRRAQLPERGATRDPRLPGCLAGDAARQSAWSIGVTMAARIEHALFRRVSAARHIPAPAWLTRGRTTGITWHDRTLRAGRSRNRRTPGGTPHRETGRFIVITRLTSPARRPLPRPRSSRAQQYWDISDFARQQSASRHHRVLIRVAWSPD
jgi:hypothetical protein